MPDPLPAHSQLVRWRAPMSPSSPAADQVKGVAGRAGGGGRGDRVRFNMKLISIGPLSTGV
eukprot:scaffold790_cov387-Prasinococcus_capsulatus_cf.AAC.16